jgi:hypothetical protein
VCLDLVLVEDFEENLTQEFAFQSGGHLRFGSYLRSLRIVDASMSPAEHYQMTTTCRCYSAGLPVSPCDEVLCSDDHFLYQSAAAGNTSITLDDSCILQLCTFMVWI